MRYAIAGTLVLTVWVMTIGLGGPMALPVVATLLAGAVLLGLFAWDRLKERRAAAALERAFRAQAENEQKRARPDLAADLAVVNRELDQAVEALKRSRGGKSALYRLPWFLMIGPPGCGKSTALRTSGLDFPFESSSGGPLRGIGGTRQCDLWLTNQAVLLDTAGRWTEDEDRDEWLGFLDLVRAHRPRFPLNGILAAISVDEVGSAREEDVLRLAERMRARIDEVQKRLEMSLPVYVLFTKCDLVVGFVEAFGDLSLRDRGQVWGFTLPLARSSARETIAAHMEELLSAIARRVERRMGEERSVLARDLLFAFPEQLRALVPNLTEFVTRLTTDDVYRETPRLRGVYFTSGTQEGRPVDRVIRKMASAFGIAETALGDPPTTPKSYFLQAMFEQVLFRDAEVASRSPHEVARQRTRTVLAAAAMLSLAVVIGTVPTYAWANNRGLLRETREVLDASQPTISGRSGGTVAPRALEPIRARFELLDAHENDGPPLGYGFGMYQSSVYEPVRATYVSTVERRVVQPILAREAAALGRWASDANASSTSTEIAERYEQLKLHILLTGPRVAGEPGWDDEQRSYTIDRLTNAWASEHGIGRRDPVRDAMRRDVSIYVASVTEEVTSSLARNEAVVSRAREQLRARMESGLAVEQIALRVSEHRPAMSLTRLLGHPSSALVASYAVPAAFTREGYEEEVRSLLANDLLSELTNDWVVGEPPAEDAHNDERRRQQRAAAIEEAYFRRYEAEWRRFIDGVTVIPVSDANRRAVLMDYLRDRPATITKLFVAMEDELTLVEEASETPSFEVPNEVGGMLDRRGGTLGGLRANDVGRLREATTTDLERRRARERGETLAYGAPDVRLTFFGWLAFARAPISEAGTTRSRAAEYEERIEYFRDALENDESQVARRRQDAIRSAEAAIEEASPEFREALRRLLLTPLA